MPLLICFLPTDHGHTEEQKQKLGEAHNEAMKAATQHGMDIIFIDMTSTFGGMMEKGLVFDVLLQPGGYSKRTKEKIAQAFSKATMDILGRGMIIFFRDMDSLTGNVAEKDHLGRFLITE